MDSEGLDLCGEEGLDLRGGEGLDLRGEELDAGDELKSDEDGLVDVPNDRGDGLEAGDELGSGEDVLVNVPSDRSGANLCADLVLVINKTRSNLFIHKSRN